MFFFKRFFFECWHLVHQKKVGWTMDLFLLGFRFSRKSRSNPSMLLKCAIEAQGRGFAHGHRKTHSYPAQSWDLLQLTEELLEAKNEEFVQYVCSLQYEASVETGRQLKVDPCLPRESFSYDQQRLSRMDGQLEMDGETYRHLIEVTAPEPMAHILHEQQKAAAERREARHSYTEVPLTGAELSCFPGYRLPQLNVFSTETRMDSCETETSLALHTPWVVDDNSRIIGIQKNDGTAAALEELHADALSWERAFAIDTRYLQQANHMHHCTTSCLKHQEKTSEQSHMKKRKTIACRFWLFRIVELLVNGRKKDFVDEARRYAAHRTYYQRINTTNLDSCSR